MPLKFNPLSSTFDLVGSAGGGSSYIDGEVQNFSALPETVGTPPEDSAYLVREAEGTWLLSRRPAGIYIRTANTGTRASDWTHASAFPDVFSDAAFTVYSDGDSTKNLQLSLSGLTTASTRTLTVPDASGTIARTEDFAAPPAIGSTTPAAGSFTTLTANDTRTATLTDLSLTMQAGSGLNNVGIQALTNVANSVSLFTGTTLIMSVQSSPSISFVRDTTLRWRASTSGPYSGTHLELVPEAAETLAQRNAANPQTFRLYNTSSSSNANFERLNLRWASNEFILDAEAGGTGTLRGIKIGSATTSLLGFYGATPVDQPALTADLLDSLQELGLVASGSGDTPLNLTGGTLTAGNLVLTDNTGDETATFDAQSNLTGNRTYTLPDASGTLALTTLVGAPIEYVIACSDEATDLTTGTAKVTFRAPVAFLLTAVAASVNTAPTGSTLIVDINNGANSALSTKLSIDASEKTSATAATAAVIDTTYDDFAADAEITIDIDQVGSTTAGKGLKVVLKGTRA